MRNTHCFVRSIESFDAPVERYQLSRVARRRSLCTVARRYAVAREAGP